MSNESWLTVERGDAPLLVSFPHTGLSIPPDCEAGLVSLPLAPCRMSLPAPPIRWSAAVKLYSTSSPPSPRSVLTPALPMMVLLNSLPVRSSAVVSVRVIASNSSISAPAVSV